VQDELDRLAVILLHELREAGERLGEGVIVVQLDRTVQGDGLRGAPRSTKGIATAPAAPASR
jgi:hypothetical protein